MQNRENKVKTAIILAAGKGERMREFFPGHKAMLPIEGKPLIEHSIEKLIRAGIIDIVIITGYKADDFQYLKDKYGYFVRLVHNENYDTTGSYESLRVASKSIHHRMETLILESDIWYDSTLLSDIMSAKNKNSIAVSSKVVNDDMVYVTYDLNSLSGDGMTGVLTDITKDKERVTSPFKYFIGVCKTTGMKLCETEDAGGIEHYEGFFLLNPEEWGLVNSECNWMEMDCGADVKNFMKSLPGMMPVDNEPYIKRNVLLNPGPATTLDSVKRSLVQPDICPRENEFKSVVKEVKHLIGKVYGTNATHQVVLIPGSGTSAVESVLSSLPPDAKLGIIENGAYGKRMKEICDTYGIKYESLDYDWSDPTIYFGDVERLMTKITHLAYVHHETTTGYMVGYAGINMLARSAGVTTIMDAMSSFAATEMPVLPDYVISSSNKSIHGFAGIGFVLVKDKEIEKNKDTKSRSYFLDLWSQERSLRKGEFRFTPPVQIIYSMREALRDFFARGGVQAREEWYREKYQVLLDGVKSLGFRTLINENSSSKILMTVLIPNNFSFDEFHGYMYERGYTVYPGKVGELNAFRLAVIGESTVEDMKKFVCEIQNFNQSRNIVAYEYSN